MYVFEFKRYCGECGYMTRWATESEAVAALYAHYGERHPYVRLSPYGPPGMLTWRRRYRMPLQAWIAAFLVFAGLIIAVAIGAANQPSDQNTPAPCATCGDNNGGGYSPTPPNYDSGFGGASGFNAPPP
ncbi:hypothetical protein [Kitasatospora sp. NPDC089509]|uniref:hypothetical protein n=1 Tax=Kitasatospora sp. NPDC089509 TaxID=3364079 RepID=UPI00382E1D2A